MASKSQDDRKKRIEKATALLTLAADQGGVCGACLTDEEMAALARGRGGGTAMPAIWEHLSTCDRCYGQWLFLKKEIKQEAAHGRLYFLRGVTNLRYLGTALAVAATVAVYVNVVKIEDTVVEQAPPPTSRLQDKNLALPPQERPAAKEEKTQSAQLMEQTPTDLPAAAPPAAPEPHGSGSAKGKLSVQSTPMRSIEKPPEERQRPAAAPMPAARKMVTGAASDSARSPAESAAVPRPATPASENAADWLEQLRAACLSGRDDAPFWQEMAARGLRLQILQAANPPGAIEVKMAQVLVLVQGINGPGTAPQQCRLILAELAQLQKPAN